MYSYGVPAYKEANPGLFTCVTFPFLFGVMCVPLSLSLLSLSLHPNKPTQNMYTSPDSPDNPDSPDSPDNPEQTLYIHSYDNP